MSLLLMVVVKRCGGGDGDGGAEYQIRFRYGFARAWTPPPHLCYLAN